MKARWFGRIVRHVAAVTISVTAANATTNREKIQDIVKLRQAVKQEARELELQLNELVHHDDDSLRAMLGLRLIR